MKIEKVNSGVTKKKLSLSKEKLDFIKQDKNNELFFDAIYSGLKSERKYQEQLDSKKQNEIENETNANLTPDIAQNSIASPNEKGEDEIFFSKKPKKDLEKTFDETELYKNDNNNNAVHGFYQKKPFMFKKTFSRLISTQALYIVNSEISKIQSFSALRITKIIKDVIEIDSEEWNHFDHKRVMMNFISGIINYFVFNHEKISEIYNAFFVKTSISDTEIVHAICFGGLCEFLMFAEKALKAESGVGLYADNANFVSELDLDPSMISQRVCHEEEDGEEKEVQSLEDQLLNQKTILINEYINITLEFADEFYVKFVNGAFEKIFTEIIENMPKYFPEYIDVLSDWIKEELAEVEEAISIAEEDAGEHLEVSLEKDALVPEENFVEKALEVSQEEEAIILGLEENLVEEILKLEVSPEDEVLKAEVSSEALGLKVEVSQEEEVIILGLEENLVEEILKLEVSPEDEVLKVEVSQEEEVIILGLEENCLNETKAEVLESADDTLLENSAEKVIKKKAPAKRVSKKVQKESEVEAVLEEGIVEKENCLNETKAEVLESEAEIILENSAEKAVKKKAPAKRVSKKVQKESEAEAVLEEGTLA